MCEPATIAYAVAAVVAAYGAYETSASNKAQAEYQSDMAANQAKISKYQAEDAVARGGEAAIQAARQAERMRGTQVVRLASNGLDISSGTPLAVLEDTMYFGQQDATMIRNNAAREAWGYTTQGSAQTASSQMYGSLANAENPSLAAGTSLLSSAGQYGMSGGFNKTPSTKPKTNQGGIVRG
jgi:hypothetical protein